MSLVKLKSNGEEYYILKSQIGHWSITPNHCNCCGFNHYVLEVYDKNNNLLCMLENNNKKQLRHKITKYYKYHKCINPPVVPNPPAGANSTASANSTAGTTP